MKIWKIDNPYYVEGNPNNWRTWFRTHLPYFLSDNINKGKDCESLDSQHMWYNIDNELSSCYHCTSEKKKNCGNNK